MRVYALGVWGTYPKGRQATTGFLVEYSSKKVLIDAGSGVLAQLYAKCHIRDIDAVIVTHHHHDHTADLGVLCYSVLLSRIQKTREVPLPLYMTSGPEDITRELKEEPFVDLHTIDEATRLDLFGATITFAQTKHAVYCLAVRIEYEGNVFVFSADSSECQALVDIAANADLFLCEASMYDGQEATAKQTGHLTARQAGTLAKHAGVKRLAITHYPHYGDLTELRTQATAGFGKDVEPLLTAWSELSV